MEYKNVVTTLAICPNCKSEITEHDQDTLLCEPCFNEIDYSKPSPLGNKKVTVFDNEDKSIDRYTVVIFNRGQYDAYGMSYNAEMPNGFNQYIGQIGDQVSQSFLDDCKEVNLKQLPKGVLVSIIDRMQDLID